MEKIGLLLAFFAILPGLFFTVARLTGGNWFTNILFRGVGLTVVILSILYILKYYSVI